MNETIITIFTCVGACYIAECTVERIVEAVKKYKRYKRRRCAQKRRLAELIERGVNR